MEVIVMEVPEVVKKLNKLLNGEKVTCTECGKGTYEPIGGDFKKTHCFKCSYCGAKINID